jgi:hypothetical protein
MFIFCLLQLKLYRFSKDFEDKSNRLRCATDTIAVFILMTSLSYIVLSKFFEPDQASKMKTGERSLVFLDISNKNMPK